LKETAEDTSKLLSLTTTSSLEDEASRTIVHEIADSKLPPSEKELSRIYDEVAAITGAGFETIDSVLRLLFYHVFSNAEILQRLRAELNAANVTPSTKIEIKSLEKLPYLTSVIMEGLRLSPAIGSRTARIAPDRYLFYGDWPIPAGTPVGMTTILIHTDETLYPDPLCFNPDRWTDTEKRKKLDKTYAPFSRGTRICLGMQYVRVLFDFPTRFTFHQPY
jgi:cytochrome P450